MQKHLHVFSVCASMKLRIGNVTESVTDNASGNEKETRNSSCLQSVRALRSAKHTTDAGRLQEMKRRG